VFPGFWKTRLSDLPHGEFSSLFFSRLPIEPAAASAGHPLREAWRRV
jgi:hypothetical protein